MKKVINGKLYDTSEAHAVCSWTETATLFDVKVNVDFVLYREKFAEKPSEGLKLTTWGGVSDWDVKKDPSKGEFFLAVQVGGSYGPGRIRPLGIDEAKRIYEEHDDAYCIEDDYEKYFGVRPQKPLISQLKEAFQAGANAKQKQYEEAEEKKRAERAASDAAQSF